MPNGIPPIDSHKITLAQAKTMINNRNNPPAGKNIDGSVKGVIFNKDVFEQLLALTQCSAIRFYFAFAEAGSIEGIHDNIRARDLVPTLIVVGVDENGKDILSTTKDGIHLDAGFENSWPSPPHGASTENLVPA